MSKGVHRHRIEVTSRSAQDEVTLMYALKDEPKTRKELAQLMNTEPSRISYLFKKLKEAGCIHRIQGSDRMALSDLG